MRIFPSLCALACTLPLAAWAGPVDINTADAATLARELAGVGEARAAAIVAHRKEHGPFRTVEDLGLVKGIGRKVIDENRANLRITTAKAPAARPPAGAAGRPGR